MSISECQNCVSLSAKCLKLEDEVTKLNKKVDHLLASLSFDKEDFGCQSSPIVHSIETQTENWTSPTDEDQQTQVNRALCLRVLIWIHFYIITLI